MSMLTSPPEVLETIVSFLSPEDVKSISLTCKLLNQITQSDQVWSRICWNRYRLRTPPNQARLFCQRVLHHYGHLLGMWKVHADCYGGLLKIEYENGKIVGKDLQLPKAPHVMSLLRPRIIFTIELSEDKNTAVTQCCINSNKRHGCQLTYGEQEFLVNQPFVLLEPSQRMNRMTVLTRKCVEGTNSDDHLEIPDFTLELQRWLNEQTDFTVEDAASIKRQLIYKYLVLRQIDLKTHYSRLILPATTRFNVPIQPGLFKGTYSVHGLELVSLLYEEDKNKVKTIKITGDPNVPAGEITFRADLPYCMNLDLDAQRTIGDIERIEPTLSDLDWNELSPHQPYVTPSDCYDTHSQLPNHCRARFHGFGQIAGTGFQNPSYVQGHWIVFNEDLFGFLWISLRSISVYHRVKKKFLA